MAFMNGPSIKKDIGGIMNYLQSLFYQTKRADLIAEIAALQETLAQVDAKRKMDLLTILSMDYMKAVLRVPTNGSGEIRKIRELILQ